MDQNASPHRRFSLIATRIPNPIAESTCVNINSKSSPTHFQWGGTPISCRNPSNSKFCSSRSDIYSQSNSASSSSRHRFLASRFNINGIDPRVYADVQSKGLASRIVKYHEKGTRLNRSASVNNLYSKPGQFPVVHLKKTALPHTAPNQYLSMTRIAPPEKSMFYGNTLPSILRSNSVMALHKSDAELSSENRPILHPPPTENELTPTRSVLEVLKEISRKRINSEHLGPKDKTKKYCNRDVDAQANGANLQHNNKRQRENLNVDQQFVQSKQQFTQHSPEQIAKKRLCSNNNDITSSLSSSQIHANKRKLYEQKRINECLSLRNLSDEFDYDGATKKQQLQPLEIRSEQNLQTLNNKSSTDYCDDVDDRNLCSASSPVPPKTQATVLPSQEPDCEVSQTSSSISKRKLTLFNKDYDNFKDVAASKLSDSDLDDAVEIIGIPFVKPKKSISISSVTNLLNERTQKSKLALMLSSLRGDLYETSEVDGLQQNSKKLPAPEQQHQPTSPSQVELNNLTTATASSSRSITPYANIAKISSTDKSDTKGDTIAAEPDTSTASAAKAISSSLVTFPVEQPISTNGNLNSNAHSLSLSVIKDKNSSSVTAAFPTHTTNKINLLDGIKLTKQPVLGSIEGSANPNIKNHTTDGSSTRSGGFSFSSVATTTATKTPQFISDAPNTTMTITNTVEQKEVFCSAISSTSGESLGFKDALSSGGKSTTATNSAVFTLNSSKSMAPTTTARFGTISTIGSQSSVMVAGTPFSFSSLGSTPVVAKDCSANTSTYDTSKVNNCSTSEAELKPISFGNTVSASIISDASTSKQFSFGIKPTIQKPSAVATPFSVNCDVTTENAPAVNDFTLGGTVTNSPENFTNSSSKFKFSDSIKTPMSFSFGAATKSDTSFSFGSSASAQTPQTKPLGISFTNKPTNFTFGSVPSTSTENQTTVFNPTTTKANVINQTFNFGSTAANAAATAATSKSIFESTSFNNNTFGSLTTSAAENRQNKAFSFGMGGNLTATASLPTVKAISGGFSFNADNKDTSVGFGFPTSRTSTCNVSGNIISAPFKFGSTSTNDSSNNASKLLSPSNTTTNLFGNASSLSAASAQTFSFSTPSSSTAADASQTSGNIFAAPIQNSTAGNTVRPDASQTSGNIFAAPIQNSTTGNAVRPFRRATRRLQKS